MLRRAKPLILGKRRYESHDWNSIDWPCGPIGAYSSAPIRDVDDMLHLLDGNDFAYVRFEAGDCSCAVEACDDCVKLYHMRLTNIPSLEELRKIADFIIDKCTKYYGETFIDCDEERFVSFVTAILLSYHEYDDVHTCEAEKMPTTTLKYPIDRNRLYDEIFEICYHPKDAQDCIDIAYEMMDDLADRGIFIRDCDYDDDEEYDDDEDEYEESRPHRESRIRRRSRLNYRR